MGVAHRREHYLVIVNHNFFWEGDSWGSRFFLLNLAIHYIYTTQLVCSEKWGGEIHTVPPPHFEGGGMTPSPTRSHITSTNCDLDIWQCVGTILWFLDFPDTRVTVQVNRLYVNNRSLIGLHELPSAYFSYIWLCVLALRMAYLCQQGVKSSLRLKLTWYLCSPQRSWHTLFCEDHFLGTSYLRTWIVAIFAYYAVWSFGWSMVSWPGSPTWIRRVVRLSPSSVWSTEWPLHGYGTYPILMETPTEFVHIGLHHDTIAYIHETWLTLLYVARYLTHLVEPYHSSAANLVEPDGYNTSSQSSWTTWL